MKNWRKLLAAGLLSLTAAVGSASAFVTDAAAAGTGYDRRETVAEEERIPAAYADSARKTDKIDPKAWKKINGVCYNGSGKPIPGAITWGMDVSEWQEKINWFQVKESGIDFAFVRIAYGTKKMDNTYAYNMEQAELAGVPVGTYVYSLATTPKMAMQEAHLAIESMKGYKVSYPVVFDLEYSEMGKLSPKKVSELALTFCNEVKKAGYYPMVYCNTNWYDNEVDWDMLEGLDVWIARYGDTIQAPPHEDYKYTIWQSTDGDGGGVLNSTKGLINGIPKYSDVDVDFGYVDYTQKITPRTEPKPGYKPSELPETDGGEKPQGKQGWATENGKTYYYKNGNKVKGWNTIDGKTYYFHLTKFYMYKNKRTINKAGDIYYFGSDGARYDNGFRTVKLNGEKKTFYFHKNGKAHKGWLTVNGKKYYFYNGTAMASGTRAENVTLTSSNKVVSVFDKKGVCIKQYKKKA